MHIEIEQSTQVIAANLTRKFYPEEIDWVLNKVQQRFIESRMRPKPDGSGGFELDEVLADDIRSLVRSNVPVTPYTETIGTYRCFLPYDYAYLLADASETQPLCGTQPTEVTVLRYVHRIFQGVTTKGSAQFYEDFAIDTDDLSVAVPGDLPSTNTYTGYPEIEDISFLTPWIIWKSKKLYWEKFADLYYPGHYIEVVSVVPTSGVITADGVVATNSVGYDTLTLKQHIADGKYHANRLSSTDDIPELRTSAFFKSTHYSPISELEAGFLRVYRDDSFIVSKVYISYIRKPQPISLSLGTDCELNESTHQKICDLATEYLQGRIKDLQGRQLSEADIAKRVIL